MNTIEQSFFPNDTFDCYVEGNTKAPLVVTPRNDVDLVSWAHNNQLNLSKAISRFGAIVFSGFNLTKDRFSEAFTAITQMSPQAYKGETPRAEIGGQVYKSTAVADGHTIPLHQEVSSGARINMPRYISFFCVTPSERGTGQTLVGNAERISKDIEALMPRLWLRMRTQKLTYTSRYLPENSWYTKWIRWLNPSHGTIMQQFGTENRQDIEEKCRNEGLTCEWDNGWAVISRKGIPATINNNGKHLFCNQIHLDKLNPALCGGWIKYFFARTFLYPTTRTMQSDVKFDDGTEITRQEASTLLQIVNMHQEGRDWKKGDIMVLDNITTLHAKTVHSGQREVLVAMSGSVEDQFSK